jgi:hypothetical protein
MENTELQIKASVNAISFDYHIFISSCEFGLV